jgi:hypothetical protein
MEGVGTYTALSFLPCEDQYYLFIIAFLFIRLRSACTMLTLICPKELPLRISTMVQ